MPGRHRDRASIATATGIGDTAEAAGDVPARRWKTPCSRWPERSPGESGAAPAVQGRRLVSLEKVTDKQWRARIKVGNDFSPNMTFSVLYVKDGDYVFQNAGIAVVQPTIELTVRSDKACLCPWRHSHAGP
ncbi:hypothetical protein ACU4GD_00760 [Cupriavidus basilensis]